MSIFEIINICLRKTFKSVRMYQGACTNGSATVEHIATGFVYGLMICLLGTICKWALFIYIPLWIVYSPFKELYLDRHKNKGRPFSEVIAQMLERSTGLVCSLPFIGICFI